RISDADEQVRPERDLRSAAPPDDRQNVGEGVSDDVVDLAGGDETARRGPRRRQMAPVQLAEGVLVAGAGARQQGLVGPRRRRRGRCAGHGHGSHLPPPTLRTRSGWWTTYCEKIRRARQKTRVPSYFAARGVVCDVRVARERGRRQPTAGDGDLRTC